MNGLALLIPIAIFMGLCALAAFFWALRRGQFEDMSGAANRILIDDEAEEERPTFPAQEKPVLSQKGKL